MWYDGKVPVVIFGVVLASALSHSSNGIRESMAQVNAGISKANACKCGCQMHLVSRLVVVLIVDRTAKVLADHGQSMPGPHVRYGIRALVSWRDARLIINA